ncbi:MAG: alpha/beta hydrolase [Trichodesmium sp. St16_bin4-tuft]|nr:alpha/beta hydrolase [Trichodesmium sp. St4_bin8_1]MDE5071796.1 alpha/beta hydrolase [Trichodesmium sp. St5_bin8]MDE5077702.1 alpha/beta hydrolase [Trichodesmium sp. St2_bin6]MDE5091668.1 alpha/beta hydrolase [Trichodesmium sp. St18_bin3_1_1]MDE5098515.1 alpha/beta hydrolase [Trichodesmium sp. St16_bin4-tuft]
MKLQSLKAKFISFSLGLSILSPIFTPILAIAAEQIIISVPDINIKNPIEVYIRDFQIKILVKSLENLAEEDKQTEEFNLYSELLKEEVYEVLQKPFNLDPTFVEAFMKEPMGKEMLKRLGKIIQTGDNQNGSEAIKKSFELALADPNGLTIINLLNKFPGDIFIELQEGVNLVDELIKNFVEKNRILTGLQRQAEDLALAEKKRNFKFFPDLRMPGNITFKKQSFSFRNPYRKRSSPVDIYLPNISGNNLIPVVVISHGLGSDISSFVYLAKHLASHGFAVIVPKHIGSDAEKLEKMFAGLSRPVDGMTFINRPLDIKYSLDEIEEKIGSDPIWQGKLNFQNVGIIGQSFGGYTALSVAGAPLNIKQLSKDCQSEDIQLILNLSLLFQCQMTDLGKEVTPSLADERIKAVIAINPISSILFGTDSKGMSKDMSEIKVPVMIIAGTEDLFAQPIPEQIYPFISLTTPEKYLVISKPGTHFSFIQEEENVPVELPKKLIGPDPNLAYPYLQALSVAFFRVYIQNQSESLLYLSESYLQYLNQEPFTFSLLKSLTEVDIQKVLESYDK